MTFSYLRAYAQSKKSNSILVCNITIIAADVLLIVSLFSASPVLLNLQLIYLVAQITFSFLILIAGLCVKESFIKSVREKNYKQIISLVQLYNYRQKYSWFSNFFSIISNGLAIFVMASLGWIWQPIVFLLTTMIGLSSLYDFVDDLPTQVEKSGLQEEDFA